MRRYFRLSNVGIAKYFSSWVWSTLLWFNECVQSEHSMSTFLVTKELHNNRRYQSQAPLVPFIDSSYIKLSDWTHLSTLGFSNGMNDVRTNTLVAAYAERRFCFACSWTHLADAEASWRLGSLVHTGIWSKIAIHMRLRFLLDKQPNMSALSFVVTPLLQPFISSSGLTVDTYRSCVDTNSTWLKWAKRCGDTVLSKQWSRGFQDDSGVFLLSHFCVLQFLVLTHFIWNRYKLVAGFVGPATDVFTEGWLLLAFNGDQVCYIRHFYWSAQI